MESKLETEINQRLKDVGIQKINPFLWFDKQADEQKSAENLTFKSKSNYDKNRNSH
ncbi:MAG: hypothetical protein HOO91_18535 [Bacteroidales bacterium]|nr:hypothetical protein [Bacteroidales bacterium]